MTKKSHIFVVDDEQDARDMVGDYLTLHGFDVTLCEDGEAMRRALRSTTPDLVLLDLNMPQEDGLSVIRYLKDECPVPVIMLTASASTIDRVVGLELGADDYLAKPCELRELLARIRSVLRRLKFSPARMPDRRLAAIVSFDIVSFSRFIQEDEPGTLSAIDALFGEVISPSLLQSHGTLFKMLGDGALVEFLSIVDAAAWAVDLQNKLGPHPRTRLSSGRLVFRVGVAVGDVIVNQTDRVGEGVTLAVRVQECAEPGGVALSDQAFQLIRGKTSARFIDGGMRVLKGIATPMHIWVWNNQGTADAR
ncbi:MAG: response regulator [Beijerinckiaceae bacterium]|nr:response regulator [Beijerinckiaceae bacterium]